MCFHHLPLTYLEIKVCFNFIGIHSVMLSSYAPHSLLYKRDSDRFNVLIKVLNK